MKYLIYFLLFSSVVFSQNYQYAIEETKVKLPEMPTTLIVSQISETSVVLTWTAPTDKTAIKDYGIYSKNILLATSTGTGTTYKVTGLSPDTTYSLTVRSIDKSGKISVDSNVQTFATKKVVIVAPVLNPPTALIASQISETSVVLTWTAPTDKTAITDYGIYSKNILLTTSVGTGTTYKVTGLSPDATYSLTVRSIDKSGKISVDSNVQTFTTKKVIIVAPVLNPPTALIASQISESSVVLTWTAPNDKSAITDYGIYSKNILLTTSVGTGTTYKVTGLSPETAYSLTVRSIDKTGKISYDSNVQTFTTNKILTVAPVLNPPTALIASQISQTSVFLTWTAPTDKTAITDYGIYSKNILLATSAVTETTYKVTGLTPDTAYSITVRSIDKAGKKSVDSNVQTFTTNKIVVVPVLNPPTALRASQISETSAVLTWTAPIDKTVVTDYAIYSNNILLATSAGTGTTYKVTGLTPETSYSLTVKSIDKEGKMSVDSNIHTFTTNNVVTVVPVLNPPTALIASQITETSVVLSWTAPSDKTAITDYGIYGKNILLATSAGTGTTYKVTGLTPETAYSLTVRSIDKAGKKSVDSNVQIFTTNKIVVVPVLNAPTSLIASNVKETSVVLNWTAPVVNDQVADYGIYSKNIMIAKALGTGTTYRVTGLTSETEYSVTVRALDKTGKMSDDSNIQKFTTERIGAPTGLVASQISETTVVLTWTAPIDNSSVKDYGIYSKNVLLATSVGTGITYKVQGLTPETAYSLTVRSIDKVGKTSLDSNVQTFTTIKEAFAKGVNNQLEEIEYFKAYLLPLAQKGTLQTALDKYGSVRLEKGNYSGVNVVMKSNQRLYGHPSVSRVSNITIAAGSSNVHLEALNLADGSITFQSGASISNCKLKTIRNVFINANNAMVENNVFLDILGNINFNSSGSGFIRNNRVIKIISSGYTTALIMKGNNATPSYGNVFVHSNFLNVAGDSSDLDTLQSSTFVGIDGEGWNSHSMGSTALLTMKNIGRAKVADFGGNNGWSATKVPTFDIDADNLFFLSKSVSGSGAVPAISKKTNIFSVNSNSEVYSRGNVGAVTGFDLKAHVKSDVSTNVVTLKGIIQSSPISNDAIKDAIVGKQSTPWNRPNWETLPSPLGADWKTTRVGKKDSTTYIQNLINANGIAELPEGIYYISSTLKISVDSQHGIVGAGTGKTAIVGLTDDFPLITLAQPKQDGYSFTLSNLTLQGGSIGLYAPDEMGLITTTNLKYLVFRNQKYGINLHWIFGLDNCFFDSISFVDCNIGFFQDPNPVTTDKDLGYVDKVVFYNGQYLNCETAVSMVATRADNLNAWVNCKFYGGNTALKLGSQNSPIVANCDFTNYSGTNVIKSNSISIYSCNIYGNSVTQSTIASIVTNIEGCKFLDSSPVFFPTKYNPMLVYIVNSAITGNVATVIPPGQSYGLESAVYVNSKFSANPTLSKLLVNVKDGVPTVLIDDKPNPYPQFLVTE